MSRVGWLGLVASILILLPAPAATAQDEVLASLAWEDRGDDLRTNTTGGIQQPVPAASLEHLDLVKASVVERNATHLEFMIGVKKLEALTAGQTTSLPERQADIHFTFGGAMYKLRSPGACPTTKYAPLSAGLVEFKNGYWGGGGCIPPVIDQNANTITYVIDKSRIMDKDRVSIRQGAVLGDWYATSSGQVPLPSTFSGGQETELGRIEVVDRAPDTGSAGTLVSQAVTQVGAGSLALKALIQSRASNGESTTLVYPMRLINHASDAANVELNVTSDESTLHFRVPARLHVPPGGQVDFPVIVTMEFTHEHGRSVPIKVRAQRQDDPTHFATEWISVYWLEFPQPAGHHDKLWLHSGPGYPAGLVDVAGAVEPRRRAWMNPLESDPTPGATDDEVRPPSQGGVNPNAARNTVEWEVPLAPRLVVGLDFDLTRPIQIEATVRAGPSTSTSSLEANLYYCDPSAQPASAPCWGSAARKIAGGKEDGGSIGTGQTKTFGFTLPVEAWADQIPFQENANLVLGLKFVADSPQLPPAPAPRASLIVRSSNVQLPLFEYHDPVDQIFQSVGSLKVEYQGPYERRLHPGTTVGYAFRVTNTGDQAHKVRVNVEGTNKDWASLDVSEFSLGRGESKEGMLRIRAPEAANSGEHAELFLIAESTNNPNVVALIRLRATVVSLEEAITETAMLSDAEAPEKRSPGAGLAAVSVALVGAILVRRRRR